MFIKICVSLSIIKILLNLMSIFDLTIPYLGNMSGERISNWEYSFYSFVSRCAEGVFVDGWSFFTGGDDRFIAELIRDNNFYWEGFGGNFWSELGNTYFSVDWCVCIPAIQLGVSITMWGGVGSKCHRGQKEQEDLKFHWMVRLRFVHLKKIKCWYIWI